MSMRFRADHDLHIHSYVSPCCGHDPRQTKEAILAYGLTNGFRTLCVTDHLWDRKVHTSADTWLKFGLDLEKGREILPLPQSPECRFLYGMEVDIDFLGNIGLSEEEFENFDFLILAPGHMHLEGFTVDPRKIGDSAEEYKRYYLERLSLVLENKKLPFKKCGLAHFTVSIKDYMRMFQLFTDQEYEQLWSQVARCGMGVELNCWTLPWENEEILRPYRIAKEMGCRFYFGGDSHKPEEFAGKKEAFERMIDLLHLTEDDKFDLARCPDPENKE